MTLAPLLSAPPITQAHAALASVALISGLVVLALPKGTATHLIVGRIFVAAMLATAATSIWITGLWPGHFSPIHILSVVTLTTLPLAILARRRGDIRAHARIMLLNFAGLAIAGAFTLSPGRVMNQFFASLW